MSAKSQRLHHCSDDAGWTAEVGLARGSSAGQGGRR